ncbi:TrmH family RNA methyltransferase [Candidatus Karelsulcia muelleri]|uniref:TrmH family RNA methyltransferase n=1 Tax=Candidatus Karelsulcia muelleri TaxID=336810 RepID=UPI000D7C7183|nr:RNA methyltransferase [Candidatus Karelsulcia muelleri]
MKKNTIMIYGINTLYEAIKSKIKIYKIYLNNKNNKNNKIKKIIKYSKKNNISLNEIINFKKIEKKNHQGVFAIIDHIQLFKIEKIIPMIYNSGKIPLLIILDSITDVRNFGSIVRTSACTGVDAIIINSVTINSDSIKTSSGGIFKIPICKEKNIIKIIRYLKSFGIQVIAVTEKTDNICYKFNYKNPTAFILGSEQKGISKKYLSLCNNTVKLPLIKNSLTSLNVSVACGAILYETIRQRLI